MRRLFRYYSSLPSVYRANGGAIAVAFVTLVGLRLEFDPSIAGADYRQMVVKKTQPLKMSFGGNTPALAQENANAETGVALANASSGGTGPLANPSAISAEAESSLALKPSTTAEAEPVHMVNLRRKVAMLSEGLLHLQQVPDYTAQFTKQELVAGELTEEQTMFVKIRHAPFSIYLKWLTGDTGREVLYVAGENSDKMIVHAGGWKARLPALSIEPESSLAMAESRHPVTKAGLLELTKLLLHYHNIDLKSNNLASCDLLENETFGDRPCTAFQVEYLSKTQSPDYRKTITLIDNEWKIPVCIRNYSWPSNGGETSETLDDDTLVEAYSYTEIEFRQQLATADFDSSNEEYRFRRN